MWAIIKAIVVFFVLRIVFGFITAAFCLTARGAKVPMNDVAQFATATNSWSFWVSLVIAVYVLIKSW